MTGTTVITDRVRPILADTVVDTTERWGNTLLMQWTNDGTLLIITFRPSSLLATALTSGTFTAISALGNTVSIGDRYQEALVDYVCYRALGQNAQNVVDRKRSRDYLQSFLIKSGLPQDALA